MEQLKKMNIQEKTRKSVIQRIGQWQINLSSYWVIRIFYILLEKDGATFKLRKNNCITIKITFIKR